MKRKSPSQIIKALRALDRTDRETLFLWLDTVSDMDAIKRMFVSVRMRDGDVEGHRLTNFGFTILKAVYDHRYIELKKPLNGKQQLRLSRACFLPYFMDSIGIGTFDVDIGVWLLLCAGDPELLDNALPLRDTSEKT